MGLDVYERALALHKKHKGKLEVCPKVPLKSKEDLSVSYTPGVAQVCKEIAKDPSKAYDYTIKGNTVAVVTDGSAVLGLGNIGGQAALPVMEGKCALFKEFADVDAVPICFEQSDAHFIESIKHLAPTFGGINLEDIAAPKCFEVEEALQDMGIPVMHDDQHGTAIVLVAALLNACKVLGKKYEDLTVTINGAGAAGYAIVKLLHCLEIDKAICSQVKELFVCDSKGMLHRSREDLFKNKYKYIIAQETNHEKREGGLKEALEGSDVFIGVSKAGTLKAEWIKGMNKDPIIFAMANPIPEIMPDEAKAAGAAIVGTGRSDFNNQINNVLAFPGIFRGALDCRATKITGRMKVAAAHAIANYIENPTPEKIIPSVLDKGVAQAVADAVKKAAIEDGVTQDN